MRRGIDEYGDDFVFGANAVPADEGAGADFDSEDPALTEWYVDATTQPIAKVTAEDVHRTLEPGRIQPRGENLPERAASGEASLTVGEKLAKESLEMADEHPADSPNITDALAADASEADTRTDAATGGAVRADSGADETGAEGSGTDVSGTDDSGSDDGSGEGRGR
ncbi:hypothetical protein [Gulosibacter sp. 10]|uniref:hypothetical protein n=1 Tax=Gulosibacter sp. 10 TaxID=1255570 RepID=UPI00097F32C5|nr:hypothetical protein [Gulosibacter sp. 10]SJM68045.1 High-affinity choline uptake protein BetT [Gulosibacter sp. 10]